MSFYELFVEQYLRLRWWQDDTAANDPERRPDADRPEDVIDDPPPPRAVQEEEEEIDVVGLDDEEELQAAEPQGDDGAAVAPDRFELPDYEEEEGEELNDVRPPSPPRLHEGPIYVPAANAAAANPNPYYAAYANQYAAAYANPYANQYAAAYANPYANQYAAAYPNPYANQYANPYANPYAYRYANHYANPYANQYAAAYANPYANPYAAYAPFGYRDAPLANLYFPPPAAAPADPQAADPNEALEFQIPQLEPETQGPLTEEECVEHFWSDDSLDEEPASLSLSGLGSSRKRRRDEDGDQDVPAARRPRWSSDEDSD